MSEKPSCVDTLSACICNLPLNHEGEIHICDCGGSWERKEDKVRILSFPLVSDSGTLIPSLGLPLPGPWMPE